MKKYFFYAAMAVATMASCTSEDDLTVDPGQQTPDAEDQVALNLSVSTPAMTVGSRGTGMVGYVGDADPSKASWDSQRLFITMVDQTTNEEYKEDGTPYFEGLEFRAPNSTENNNIRFYQNETYGTVEADKGVLEYKYYPIVGEYTFYGWHIDDAAGTIEKSFGIVEGNKQAKVSGIVINGTQDILAANTVKIPAVKPTAAGEAYYAAAKEVDDKTYETMVAKQFSARTARNNFTPILNFEHVLSRLQFFVKAGKGTDAALNYMKEVKNTTEDEETGESTTTITYVATDRTSEEEVYKIHNDVVNEEKPESATNYDNWEGTDEEFTKYSAAGMLNGAIYVTGVKVLGVYDNIELNLIDQTAVNAGQINENGFTLKSTSKQYNDANKLTDADEGYLTTKMLGDLVAVAPAYTTDHTNYAGNEADQVGESIMFLPVTGTQEALGTDKEIKIQVQLGQCLIKTEDENKDASSPTKYTYYWDTPNPVTLTLDASTIKFPEGSNFTDADKVFKAGRSYNVYITIYGRERIEVSANLVPWEEGGDIETDIENGK